MKSLRVAIARPLKLRLILPDVRVLHVHVMRKVGQRGQ